MRLTHYDELKKRWQINNDYGAVIIDDLNYAVGEAVDKLAAYENAGLAPLKEGQDNGTALKGGQDDASNT